MANENIQYHHESRSDALPTKAEELAPAAEATDRGLFDFVGAEGQKCDEVAISDELDEKVKIISEENKEEEIKKKNEGLLEKLHRSNSFGSSSSDEEEVEEGGKKKKGLKEKIKEKISGEENAAEVIKYEDTSVPIEKLPGGKKADDVSTPPPTPAASEYAATLEAEGKEKKGFLDKIKEKIPGYHSKSDEENEKEQKKDAAYH